MLKTTPFASTIQKSEEWVNDVGKVLEWNDKRLSLRALRVVLHTLRDRLPVNEAVQLGAQMPTLIRGVYYEGWRPSETPDKRLDRSQLLGEIEDALEGPTSIDPEVVCRAVYRVLGKRISTGEIRDVVGALPAGLRDLWPNVGQAAHV